MQSWSAHDTKKYCARAAAACRRGRVVRVEHLGQVLAADLVLDRAPVLADLERVEIELLVGDRAPQPQEVGGRRAEAGDRDVVRDALHDPLGDPAHVHAPVLVDGALGVSAEADPMLDLEPADLPRVAVAQPAVGALDLPAVADVLIEDPELIAQPVADRGQVERRQRVHEARGEPAEATIAEPGLLLVLDQLLERRAGVAERRARGLGQPERQQVRAELRADQVLRRQVDHRAMLALEEPARRVDPAMEQPVAHRVGEREVVVVAGGDAGELRELEVQLGLEVMLESGRLVGRAVGRHVQSSTPARKSPSAMRSSSSGSSSTKVTFLNAA